MKRSVREELKASTERQRERLNKAVAKWGIDSIEEVIEAGPFEIVKVDGPNGTKRDIYLHEDRSRLWQYAMNFAADRGGLSRAEVVKIDDSEGQLVPIAVVFRNFERPADT